MGVGKGGQGGSMASPRLSHTLFLTFQISKIFPFLIVNIGSSYWPPWKIFFRRPWLRLVLFQICYYITSKNEPRVLTKFFLYKKFIQKNAVSNKTMFSISSGFMALHHLITPEVSFDMKSSTYFCTVHNNSSSALYCTCCNCLAFSKCARCLFYDCGYWCFVTAVV